MTTRRRFLTFAASTAVPSMLCAQEDSSLEAPLTALITTFLKERGFPGAQLAVGRAGQIVISKGFGLADREKNLPVQSRTLFRIASVTKPLTSVAIFTLIEAGKLTLDTKMLDVLKIEPFLPKGKKVDPRLKDITIRNLLQHTGGWNRDKSGDIMFEDLRIAKTLGVASPPSARDVIREALARPLDFDPGSSYAYSNFGFCTLGRIIENLGGSSYDGYVKEHVLKPANVTGPKLGATLAQAEGEARYYAPHKDGAVAKAPPVFPNLPDKVALPYGAWCLEHMDSHGGWIACAEDMVRFIMSLDDIGRSSPFGKRQTFDAMLAPAPGAPGHDKEGTPLPRSYACGFQAIRGKDGISFMHGGSLPGTSTSLVHRADGWNWALFFNQRARDTDAKVTIVDDIQKVFEDSKSGAALGS